MTDNSTRNKEVLKLKIFLKLASLMLAKQLDEEKSLKLGMELQSPDKSINSEHFKLK
jgi:hypothetical protein